MLSAFSRARQSVYRGEKRVVQRFVEDVTLAPAICCYSPLTIDPYLLRRD